MGHNPFLLAASLEPTPVGLRRPEETPWGGHGSPSSLPDSWHSCLLGDAGPEVWGVLPSRASFCCPYLSEAAGSRRLAQVCLPNRLKGSGHVDPGQGCLGQPRVQPGGNAGDTERPRPGLAGWGFYSKGRPSGGLHLQESLGGQEV